MRKKLIIYTDGASRGNPGPAGIGIVICDGLGKVVKEYKEFIGNATNNIAEYLALIKALELAGGFPISEIECFSDSELMVRQLNGAYGVKNGKLGKLFFQVREKEKRFERVNYIHVPREEDLIKRADKLANHAIDEFKMMEREREKDGWNYFVKGKGLFLKYEDNLPSGYVKEIEMSFRKAIELNPKLWAPHYHLGKLFYLTRRLFEAITEFERAIEK
ncbi:MAG: reverse transcriptase-like protein, partial [Methanophagales archaeon]|nr:reverse transcriptase-like protein [Methanophagales archaeon]